MQDAVSLEFTLGRIDRLRLRGYITYVMVRLHKKYGHLVCTLSGDWHHTMEDKPPAGPRAHMMRVMLIQNIAVDQRFANGTQGRLLHWHPGATESRRKALPAYCSELLVRFCKESALAKMEMMPGLFVFLGYKNGS